MTGRGAAGLAALISTGLVACGSSSTASPGAGYAGHTINLGAILSRTGAGGVYGPVQQQAIELARDTLNAMGGVDGAMLAIDFEDDASDKGQAAQLAQSFVQAQRVLGILGPTLSNSAVAAHPVANQAQTPVVAISNTGVGIVGSACPYPCRFIFRDSLGEADAIPANVRQLVQSRHPHTAVILYANDDKFSSDGEKIFKRELGNQGVALAGDIGFSKNEVDLRSFATQALGYHPDLVVISTLGGVAGKMMPALRGLGYTGAIIGGNGLNTNAVSAAAGAAGREAQSASAYYVGNQSDDNRRFVRLYRNRYHQDPDQIAAQAYTGVLIFAAAARSAHLGFTDLKADRAHLRDALEHVSLRTPLGQFTFTPGHDVEQVIYIVAMDGLGGFRLVSTVPPG